jgi:transposase
MQKQKICIDMAAKTITMSTIKQIIRLHLQGRAIKQISRTCSVSRNTVRKYVALYQQLPYSTQELLSMDDHVVEQLILPAENQCKPDRYTLLHAQLESFVAELDQVGVNRFLLWAEYRQKYPGGYSYSQFCYHLQQYVKFQKTSMVMEYKPGDLLFIDFAGHPLHYADTSTGELIPAAVFVGCLGYSQYSFVLAVPTQKAEDLITALNACLHYMGGVPLGIVPDNMKTAVRKTDRYEPELNKILQDWANHNGTTIIPARSRHPQDKSLAENLVKQAYSRIYAPLRKRIFTSIAEMNEAVKEQLALLNQQKFQRKDFSRNDLFLSQEKSALAPLAAEPFQVKKYRTLTLQKNCHIYLTEDKHYYSAPLHYIGQKLEVVYTSSTVTLYAKGKVVAQHLRERKAHRYTTVAEHLPSHYRQYKDRSPDYYKKRAGSISKEACLVITQLLSSRKHPEVLYKSCEGILSLTYKATKEEFANACRMAIEVGACNYSFIRNVLSNGMARNYQPEPDLFNSPTPVHGNLRGKNYYQ